MDKQKGVCYILFKDNFKWAFDYFFNRVKSNVTNQPFILNDENQIEKEVNPQAVSFKGKVIDTAAPVTTDKKTDIRS